MNELYTFTIFPIELLYKYIYLALSFLLGNYGIALLALSLLNYFLLMPLNKLVRGLQLSENNIQEILTPQLKAIKESSLGEVRHQRIQNLYKRYSYHPIFALRNAFPLLAQLPFLMAVYFMLSSLENIQGLGFLFLQNLATPDALLFGYNILPFVMTIASLLNACFIVPLSKSQRRQAVIISLLFFILLYTAPSGLLLYWTMNNVLILAFGILGKFSTLERVRYTFVVLKDRFLPSFFESSGPFLALSFFVPLLFTFSLNVNLFSDEQIAKFVIFAASSCVALLATGILFDKLIKARIAAKKKKINLISKLYIYLFNSKKSFYLFIALCGVYFSTSLCINIKLYSLNTIVIYSVRILLITVLFFVIKKIGFKIVNITMFALLCFCCFQLARNKKIDDEITQNSSVVMEEFFSRFPLNEKLDNRPNIYLVYLESYMNSKVIRETYNYDNSLFENALTKHGFEIYENIYSNAQFTLSSLISLFTMHEKARMYFQFKTGVATSANDLIGGSNDNLLYKFLKNNDYIISSYYDQQHAYFTRKGALLDHTFSRTNMSLSDLLKEISPHLIQALQHLKIINYNHNLPVDIYPKTFQHIKKIRDFKHPSFFIIKPLNNLHVTIDRKDHIENYQTWIESGIYQKGLKEQNIKCLQVIEEIEKNDPDALILLLGDHGHRFIVTSEKDWDILLHKTLSYIKSEHSHLNMTSQEIIDDIYSVFLAIRMPKSAKGKLNINSTFSYSDLFKHIFAALDDNAVYLEHKSENISINGDGVILRKENHIFEDEENK